MSISPLPWTIKVDPASPSTLLLDAQGRTVAFFRDGRDADFVLSLFSRIEELENEEKEKITELKQEIEELEEECKELRNSQ